MASSKIPERIHRYKILSEIGHGAMGCVYLAEDPNIGRRLALKVISPRKLVNEDEEEELRDRFLREARAAGRLHHPGIVTIFDADTDPATGDPYLAMEYVPGETLRDLLLDGPLAPVQVAHYGAQVARALDAAHRQGIVHRDVKPANLLITEEGVVKILDFGIAKVASESHTHTGMLLGTPIYMAPEQLRGQPLDGRADLFALGAVLWEAAVGKPLLRGETLAEIGYRILSVEPGAESREAIPDLPPSFDAALRRALAKPREDRFADGLAMAEAFDAVVVDLGGMPSGVIGSSGVIASGVVRAARASVLGEAATRDGTLDGATLPMVADNASTTLAQELTGEDSTSRELSGGPDSFEPDDDEETRREIPITDAAPVPRNPSSRLPMAVGTAVGVVLILGVVWLGILGKSDANEPASPRVAPPVAPSTTAPPVEPETAAPSPPPVSMATFEVIFESRFRDAEITVWVDGERRFQDAVEAGSNPLRRLTGKEYRRTLDVVAGRRLVVVELALGSRSARGEIEADFAADASRRLRVRLDRAEGDLVLTWEDPS